MKSRQRDSSVSPRFCQPATFMRLPHETDLRGVDVALLGVPFDSGTSYRPGARLAPREIRAQSSLIRPYSYFQRISPLERLTIVDAGDVDAPPVEHAEATLDRIGAQHAPLVRELVRNLVTAPGTRAVRDRGNRASRA